MTTKTTALASTSLLLSVLSVLAVGCSAETAVDEDTGADALRRGNACTVRIDEKPYSESAPTCTYGTRARSEDERVRFVGCGGDDVCVFDKPFDPHGAQSAVQRQGRSFYEKSGRCVAKQDLIDRAVASVSRLTGEPRSQAHGELFVRYHKLPGDFSACPEAADLHYDLPAVAEPPETIDGITYNLHAGVPIVYRVRVDLSPEPSDRTTPRSAWVSYERDLTPVGNRSGVAARSAYNPSRSAEENRSRTAMLGFLQFYPLHSTSASSLEQLSEELTRELGGEVTFLGGVGEYRPPEGTLYQATVPAMKELEASELLAASPLISRVLYHSFPVDGLSLGTF